MASSRTFLRVTNPTRQTSLVEAGRIAETAWTRMVGLLGDGNLSPGDGLLIIPCNSIHSFGMRFIFDALFLDRRDRVIHQKSNMKPWRTSAIHWSCASVLELPPGTILSTQTEIGDKLLIERYTKPL